MEEERRRRVQDDIRERHEKNRENKEDKTEIIFANIIPGKIGRKACKCLPTIIPILTTWKLPKLPL